MEDLQLLSRESASFCFPRFTLRGVVGRLLSAIVVVEVLEVDALTNTYYLLGWTSVAHVNTFGGNTGYFSARTDTMYVGNLEQDDADVLR